MKKNRSLLLLTLAVIGFTSCEKDKDDDPAPDVTTGVYVLNEGLFNKNNTTLTYFDFNTGLPSTDFYQKTNSSKLGDTGNDILIYGSKMYIVMHVSSLVQVADALTGTAIKQIPFSNGGVNRLPRYIIAYKNKVLVSAYDGTVAVIDTTTLSIDKDITVGPNPEQMAIIGDKLYVANSGSFNATPDSTISIINLNTFTEIEKIKAGHINPSALVADEAGNLYVGCLGDFFTDVPAKLTKINAASKAIVKVADTIVGKLAYHDGALYATGGYGGSGNVRKLRLTDFSQYSPNFVTDATVIETPYGITVDPENGDVWITDAKDFITSGAVYCFNKNGQRKLMFTTDPGLNPNKVVFIKR